jgi:hypothetical protein
MYICFLAGGLGMSITTGSVDVLFVQATAVKTQGSVSASVDLALGRCLLVFGALVATDRATPAEEAKGQSWSDRMVGHPRLGLALVISALAGRPGRAASSGSSSMQVKSQTVQPACGDQCKAPGLDPMPPLPANVVDVNDGPVEDRTKTPIAAG